MWLSISMRVPKRVRGTCLRCHYLLCMNAARAVRDSDKASCDQRRDLPVHRNYYKIILIKSTTTGMGLDIDITIHLMRILF